MLFLCKGTLNQSDFTAAKKKIFFPGTRRQGRAQGEAIGAIAPTKTYESNFIHHDFVQFGKQHSQNKGLFAVHCFVTAVL